MLTCPIVRETSCEIRKLAEGLLSIDSMPLPISNRIRQSFDRGKQLDYLVLGIRKLDSHGLEKTPEKRRIRVVLQGDTRSASNSGFVGWYVVVDVIFDHIDLVRRWHVLIVRH